MQKTEVKEHFGTHWTLGGEVWQLFKCCRTTSLCISW